MEIYSLSFFLLVSVGLILYYTVFSRCQWICLLGLSLLFFTASGWKGLVFLLFTALTIWLGGLQLAKLDADSAARRKAPGISKDEKKAIKAEAVRRKKCLVAAVLTANFLVLGYFKYWSYFAELLSGAFSATAPSSLGLVMPLGISFYTFQAVGYLIDCYRGRHPAEKNYVRFLLFISFFPQLIQGPHQPLRRDSPAAHRPSHLELGAYQTCTVPVSVRRNEEICHRKPDRPDDCRHPRRQ